MTTNFLLPVLFGFSAIYIMLGVFFQSKAVLERDKSIVGYQKYWAISMKYFGFAMLAYLVYEYRSENLFFNLSVFIAIYFFSFLLYLLARRVSLR